MPFCPSCGASVEGRFCAKCGAPVEGARRDAGSAAGPTPSSPGTAVTGMEDNVAGALCYLVGFITGVLFLVLEPYSKRPFVRFHAFQSILFCAGLDCFVHRLEHRIRDYGSSPSPRLVHFRAASHAHRPARVSHLALLHVQGIQPGVVPTPPGRPHCSQAGRRPGGLTSLLVVHQHSAPMRGSAGNSHGPDSSKGETTQKCASASPQAHSHPHLT